MAIAKTIRAKDGDTLCSIAVENGFKNCTKLRADNPDFNDRQLRQGDRVNVPEVTQKQEPGAVDTLHKFVRKGKSNRVFIIQDRDRPAGEQARSDAQKELAVSNYVPGRQGRQFATNVWRDAAFTDFDDDASADPDHFKLLVFDKFAHAAGLTEVQVSLQAQKPVLGSVRNEIARWEDLTDPGTKLENIVCKQFKPDTPWYRSPYMRLVVDPADQNARAADGTDTADDRTRQTLVVPAVKDAAGNPDRQIEILDLRAEAFRPAPDCEHGDVTAPGHCRAHSFANVGKTEKVLRVKVFRITGTGAVNAINNAQIERMLFEDYRLTLAQANVGIEVISIEDVAPPRNMITVSDLLTGGERRATGGQTIGATVTLSTGDVTATITTVRNQTPQQTAEALATALRAQGVTCRVSPNPPELQGDPAFGSCDILCFNADKSLAPILTVRNAPGEAQQLLDTSGWNNSRVREGSEYTTPAADNEPRVRFIMSMDFRAAAKNYNTGTDHLSVLLVNLFAPLPPPPGGGAPGTLLGFAMIPYRLVTPGFGPVREMTMGVFLDQNGAVRRTVLPHEAGHVLLDAIHTTDAGNPESDFSGNAFPNNARLAFSEWMAAFSRETAPPFMHRRMSDEPLNVEVEFVINKLGLDGNPGVRRVLLGSAGNPAPVQRFRTVSATVLGDLRRLHEAPTAPL